MHASMYVCMCIHTYKFICWAFWWQAFLKDLIEIMIKNEKFHFYFIKCAKLFWHLPPLPTLPSPSLSPPTSPHCRATYVATTNRPQAATLTSTYCRRQQLVLFCNNKNKKKNKKYVLKPPS